jgi:hypothetical protein
VSQLDRRKVEFQDGACFLRAFSRKCPARASGWLHSTPRLCIRAPRSPPRAPKSNSPRGDYEVIYRDLTREFREFLPQFHNFAIYAAKGSTNLPDRSPHIFWQRMAPATTCSCNRANGYRVLILCTTKAVLTTFLAQYVLVSAKLVYN